MKHVLDRPVWSALTTKHACFSLGDSLARRYPPSIVPFAAAAADGTENLRALDELIAPHESVLMLQAEPIVLPPRLCLVSTATGVQMIADKPLQTASDPRLQPLAKDDAAEMLALASLTRPGPFTLRALSLGEFWGVKIDGRLVAMAGERMKQPGYAELSGVCAHPGFRGSGLGRLLSLFVANQIIRRGETAYLHAYATNATAIRLYESIGFRLRTIMQVAVVGRAGEAKHR